MNKTHFKNYVKRHGPISRRADYSMYTELIRLNRKKPLKIKGEWLNYKKQWQKDGIQSPPEFGKETTYSDFLDWEATFTKGQIVVTITLHSKGFTYNSRERYEGKCRFTVTGGVPARLFEHHIIRGLKREAVRREEHEEELRRQERRQEIFESLQAEIELPQKERAL